MVRGAAVGDAQLISISDFGIQDGASLCDLFSSDSEGVFIGMTAQYFINTPLEGTWNPSFQLSFDPATLFNSIEVAVIVRPNPPDSWSIYIF